MLVGHGTIEHADFALGLVSGGKVRLQASSKHNSGVVVHTQKRERGKGEGKNRAGLTFSHPPYSHTHRA